MKKTIDQLTEGVRVHGKEGYSIVRKDTNSPHHLYYSFAGNVFPEGWGELEIIEVSDDDVDYVAEAEIAKTTYR